MAPQYLTEATTVTGIVSIFAAPNPHYDPLRDTNDPFYTEPFRYVLREGETHYNDDYVFIVSHEVTLGVPDGINLVEKAVHTLTDKIAEKRAKMQQEINLLEQRIQALQLLTHQTMPMSESSDAVGN